MVAAKGLNFGFFCSKRLGSNCPIGIKQCLDDLGDRALQESGVIVDEIGEAVFIEGSVDLLHDGSLDEVAGIELGEVVLEAAPGIFDLCCCRVWQV